MERLRSLKHKVSVRRLRRRSQSPGSSTSSLASNSRNSSTAELSSSVTSSPARGGVSSLSSSWTAAEAPPSSQEPAADQKLADSHHGAEGQAGVPRDTTAPAATTTPESSRAEQSTSLIAAEANSSTINQQHPIPTSADVLANTSTDVDPAKSQILKDDSPAAAVSTAVDPVDSGTLPALRQRRTDKETHSTSLPVGKSDKPSTTIKSGNMVMRRSWVVLAAVSGCFAALNGTFAKLTTADRTDSIAAFIAAHTGLDEHFLNPVFRGFFFLLNLLSNAIMWALFTRALTAHTSTTQVSLINTSANFLLTAALGFAIFSEALPPAWFGGATLLVLGTVIIGRDRKGEDATTETVAEIEEEETVAPVPVEKDSDSETGEIETTRLLAGDEHEGVAADGEHRE